MSRIEKDIVDGETVLSYTFKAEDTVDTVTLGLLSGNAIPALLKAFYFEENNIKTVKYYPGQMKSVSEISKEPVSYHFFADLLSGMIDVLQVSDRYMIHSECLLMDADCVFYDFVTSKIGMICIPVCGGKISNTLKNDFMTLLSSFSPIDRKSKSIKEKAIGYLRCHEPFSLSGFRSFLLTVLPDEEQESDSAESEIKSDTISEIESGDFSAEPPVKHQNEAEKTAVSFTPDITFKMLLKNFSLTNLCEYLKSKKREQTKDVFSESPSESNTGEVVNPFGTRRFYLLREKTGGIIPISSNPFVIGKDHAESDGVIDCNGAISRKHASLSFIDGSWFISDLNSTNGTYINIEKLVPNRQYRLAEHDGFCLADEVFSITEYGGNG